MRIFLDPGHGGADPGAVGPTGLRESAIAMQVAHEALRRLAAAGYHVELSRDDDTQTMSLEMRADMANGWHADAFVSIHCNAAANPAARGYEVWTTKGQTAADPLAQELFFAVGRAFPCEPARKDRADGDDDKEAGFAVLRRTKAPAALVELGFISNPETEAAMRSPSWISAAAGAIVTGIDHWAHSLAAAKGASA